ncbi:hypothetical protein TeGR_g7429 [Tetraparma gracilis]|uniref:Uncharacterized protein n=1 Tax=Tetraparma gracilis TaxID=2962635 RepID=A0ABQ6N9B8_9STRA|nr:hypothetical protein TeGR_g7429 [Tetraparma gracilis]
MSHAILVLHSSNVGQAVQSGNTERCFSLLSAKKIEPLRVDGSDEAQLAPRDKLFGVSGIRGNYPQVFKVPIGYDVAGGGAESVEFVGAWGKVEELNEMNEIPKDVLAANPDIVTLDSVLANVATSA